jgi:hypothetical protein
LSWCKSPPSPSPSYLPPSLEHGVGKVSTLSAFIYYLTDEEHEYEDQDEGDNDDMRDGIVMVHLTPLPLPLSLLLASLAGARGGESKHPV